MSLFDDNSINIFITRIKLIQAQCAIISSAFYKNYNYFTNFLSRGVGGDVRGGPHDEGVDEKKEQLDGREEDHLDER